MPSPDESSQESPAQFTTTHWSVVLRAGQEDAPAAREALETLCRAYWRPLYIFARRFRQTEQDAEDLTQAFIARFLERGYIRAADPRRGRFRSFLLTSFKHFINTDWTRT